MSDSGRIMKMWTTPRKILTETYWKQIGLMKEEGIYQLFCENENVGYEIYNEYTVNERLNSQWRTINEETWILLKKS